MVSFQQFKIYVTDFTGLDRDSLHIYVGVGVFLLSLLITRALVKRHLTRLNMALLMVTFFALLGEYLDLSHNYPHITGEHLRLSIHDIINTCFWPYALYALNRWTPIFTKDS